VYVRTTGSAAHIPKDATADRSSASTRRGQVRLDREELLFGLEREPASPLGIAHREQLIVLEAQVGEARPAGPRPGLLSRLGRLLPVARRRRREALEDGALYDEQLDSFRWLLEEFRVSLFAQRLGTDGKVSEKRLAQAWSKTGRA